MAASAVYTIFAGIIIHENRGGTERDYMPDSLGSTAALLDNSQTQVETWTYWPYGEVRLHSGSNVTPFLFLGTLGYMREEVADDLYYVRARYLSSRLAAWITPDSNWPNEPSYTYCANHPTYCTDPTGNQPTGNNQISGLGLNLGCDTFKFPISDEGSSISISICTYLKGYRWVTFSYSFLCWTWRRRIPVPIFCFATTLRVFLSARDIAIGVGGIGFLIKVCTEGCKGNWYCIAACMLLGALIGFYFSQQCKKKATGDVCFELMSVLCPPLPAIPLPPQCCAGYGSRK